MTSVTHAGWPGALGLPGVAVYAAMLCAGAAAWQLSERDEGARRARLLLAGGLPLAQAGPRLPAWLHVRLALARTWLAGRGGHAWWCLPAGGVLALLGASWLPLLGGLAAVPLVHRWLHARERRRAAERVEAAVVELCGSVSGELRTGRTPDAALVAGGESAVRELGADGGAVLAAARFGGDVPAALRAAAARPGAAGLGGVAACWQVAVEGGTGLAEGLDRVAAVLRAEQEQREDLRALLAGPRATAVLLACLPVLALLLGGAMGAGPLRVLLHGPLGLGCLLAGGVLEAAGLLWVSRLVRWAETGTAGARPAPDRVPEREGEMRERSGTW